MAGRWSKRGGKNPNPSSSKEGDKNPKPTTSKEDEKQQKPGTKKKEDNNTKPATSTDAEPQPEGFKREYSAAKIDSGELLDGFRQLSSDSSGSNAIELEIARLEKEKLERKKKEEAEKKRKKQEEKEQQKKLQEEMVTLKLVEKLAMPPRSPLKQFQSMVKRSQSSSPEKRKRRIAGEARIGSNLIDAAKKIFKLKRSCSADRPRILLDEQFQPSTSSGGATTDSPTQQHVHLSRTSTIKSARIHRDISARSRSRSFYDSLVRRFSKAEDSQELLETSETPKKTTPKKDKNKKKE